VLSEESVFNDCSGGPTDGGKQAQSKAKDDDDF